MEAETPNCIFLSEENIAYSYNDDSTYESKADPVNWTQINT